MVERHLAKVDVAGSTPVSRSSNLFHLSHLVIPGTARLLLRRLIVWRSLPILQSTNQSSHSMGSTDRNRIQARFHLLVPGSLSCRNGSSPRRSTQDSCPLSDKRTS